MIKAIKRPVRLRSQGQGHDFCPRAVLEVEDSPRGPDPCKLLVIKFTQLDVISVELSGIGRQILIRIRGQHPYHFSIKKRDNFTFALTYVNMCVNSKKRFSETRCRLVNRSYR